MASSLWRLAHMILSSIGSVFFIVLSLTGIILGTNSAMHQMSEYNQKLNQITLSELILSTKGRYGNLQRIEIENGQRIIIEATDEDWDEVRGYVNTKGDIIGPVDKKNNFVQWCKNLHRSLFLNNVGRMIVGFVSFLLLAISVSGIALVAKKQGGFRNFFSKTRDSEFCNLLHTITGRIMFFPLIVVAVSGLYLSIYRFFLEENTQERNLKSEVASEFVELEDVKAFKDIPLSLVCSVTFALEDEPESFHTIKLRDREINISAQGEILKEKKYGGYRILREWSYAIHTGNYSFLWSMVLVASCLAIILFIVSGFKITIGRKKFPSKNKIDYKDGEFVILYGSEMGNTLEFANHIHDGLTKEGKKSYITEINSYREFENAKYMVFLTSTYAMGDAPSNADRIWKLLQKYGQRKETGVCVVGFGSVLYKDYCKFAIELNRELERQKWANIVLPLYKIDDRSVVHFNNWISDFNCLCKTSIPKMPLREEKLKPMKVISKSSLRDSMFALEIKTGEKFNSADHLAVYPDGQERLYSISKIGGKINLIIKLIENGKASTMLYNLNVGDTFRGKIIKNKTFSFPKKGKVLLLCNGTGIGAFVGAVLENPKIYKCIYAGFRYKTELTDKIEKLFEREKSHGGLLDYKFAYSKQQGLRITDLLIENSDSIASLLKENSKIMICGSVSMFEDVKKILGQICLENGIDFEKYMADGLLKAECY